MCQITVDWCCFRMKRYSFSLRLFYLCSLSFRHRLVQVNESYSDLPTITYFTLFAVHVCCVSRRLLVDFLDLFSFLKYRICFFKHSNLIIQVQEPVQGELSLWATLCQFAIDQVYFPFKPVILHFQVEPFVEQLEKVCLVDYCHVVVALLLFRILNHLFADVFPDHWLELLRVQKQCQVVDLDTLLLGERRGEPLERLHVVETDGLHVHLQQALRDVESQQLPTHLVQFILPHLQLPLNVFLLRLLSVHQFVHRVAILPGGRQVPLNLT